MMGKDGDDGTRENGTRPMNEDRSRQRLGRGLASLIGSGVPSPSRPVPGFDPQPAAPTIARNHASVPPSHASADPARYLAVAFGGLRYPLGRQELLGLVGAAQEAEREDRPQRGARRVPEDGEEAVAGACGGSGDDDGGGPGFDLGGDGGGGGDGGSTTQSFFGGGPTGLGGGFFGGGIVLGASTSTPSGGIAGETCGLYLNAFLRQNHDNNPEQVRKLQTFLNNYLGINLPITGFFGPLTYQAVLNFQQQNAEHVLTPWGIDQPTGIVYLTTLRWINLLQCSQLNLDIPPLTPWAN